MNMTGAQSIASMFFNIESVIRIKQKGESRLYLALVGICIVLGILLQACGGRSEMFYSSLADATKAGEISRGWIPDFLPNSTLSIHITYDPSSPQTWCAFEFSSSDAQSLREKLTSVAALPQRVKRVDNPGVSWWPDFLTGDLNPEKLRERDFDLYVVTEPAVESHTNVVLFAIDWKKGLGFFYRTTGE